MSTHDVATILADPAKFGFTFKLDKVMSSDVEYLDTPVVQITDQTTFAQHFPDVAAEAVNASVRIRSQGIGRDCRVKGIKDAKVIMTKNINSLLGVRTAPTRTLYKGPNGETFTDEMEAKKAWLVWAAEQRAA